MISSIRVVNGVMRSKDKLRFMQAGASHDPDEIGVRTPDNLPVDQLGPGETGYLIAGIKDVGEAKSGETVTTEKRGATEPLDGYKEPKPMVFSGLYPIDGDQFTDLREALEKLRLNDSSFTFEPETSGALGFGFRCGFLGLLHMEIVRERLEREFGLSLISTAPSVEYHITKGDGSVIEVSNPSEMPSAAEITAIAEPYLKASILTPTDYTGTVMDLCQTRRGEMVKMEYLSPERVELHYRLPLAEVVIDFFDQLKSRTQGYASLDYEQDGYTEDALVRVDILCTAIPSTPSARSFTRTRPTTTARRWPTSSRSSSRARTSRCRSRRRSAARSSPARTSRRTERTSPPSSTAATSREEQAAEQAEGRQEADEIHRRVDIPQEAFISALQLDD